MRDLDRIDIENIVFKRRAKRQLEQTKLAVEQAAREATLLSTSSSPATVPGPATAEAQPPTSPAAPSAAASPETT